MELNLGARPCKAKKMSGTGTPAEVAMHDGKPAMPQLPQMLTGVYYKGARLYAKLSARTYKCVSNADDAEVDFPWLEHGNRETAWKRMVAYVDKSNNKKR